MTWESISDSLLGWLWSALGWLWDAFLDMVDHYIGLGAIAWGVIFVGGGTVAYVIAAMLYDRYIRAERIGRND